MEDNAEMMKICTLLNINILMYKVMKIILLFGVYSHRFGSNDQHMYDLQAWLLHLIISKSKKLSLLLKTAASLLSNTATVNTSSWHFALYADSSVFQGPGEGHYCGLQNSLWDWPKVLERLPSPLQQWPPLTVMLSWNEEIVSWEKRLSRVEDLTLPKLNFHESDITPKRGKWLHLMSCKSQIFSLSLQ